MKNFSILTMFITLPLIALSSSCKGRLDPEDGMAEDKSAPISFVVGQDTKGTRPIDDKETLARYGFGVYAGYTQPGVKFGSGSQAANYMKNTKIEQDPKSPDKWIASNQFYWPINGSLSFFGYAPYFKQQDADANGQSFIIPSKDYKGGLLRGTYKPDPNVTTQLDLCLSIPVLDRLSSEGPVPMNFKHALTRVFFFVNGLGADSDRFRYRVTDIYLKGVVGTNTVTYVMDEDVPFEWDPIRDTTARDGEYHLTYNRDQPHLTDSWVKVSSDSHEASKMENFVKINSTDNGRLYLLPQELTDDATVQIVLTAYTLTGSSWTIISELPPVEYKLPRGAAWEPSKTISYFATIDIPNLCVFDMTAYKTDWEDSGNVFDPQFID